MGWWNLEKKWNNRPEIPNPPDDPKSQEIKLFATEKDIPVLVVPKQVFLAESFTTQGFWPLASKFEHNAA